MNIKISIENLRSYFSEDLIRDYAMFLFVKSQLYAKKSCLYEYNPDKLASYMGVCRNTAISYLKRFEKRGWVRRHNGSLGVNITFINTNKFPGHLTGVLVNFNVKGNVKSIEQDLYLLFLKYKQNQFNRIKELGHAINTPSPSSLKALKICRKHNYSVDNLPDQNAKFKVSIRTIANWFCCSVGKASQIITHFKNRGLIIVESSRQILCKTKCGKTAGAFLDSYTSSYFTGKYVIRVACNCYQF